MTSSILPTILPNMKRKLLALAVAGSLAATLSGEAMSASVRGDASGLFQPIGTFDVMAGNGSGVAEIIDFSRDGRTLIYTDAENQEVGFVDIADPANPKGKGTLGLGGEPTSLVIRGSYVLIGVNTSESFTNPSGKLVVVSYKRQRIVAELDLGGQPDSIALSPNRRMAAVVIENERDEDLNDGLLPQAPSGKLLIVDLKGSPKRWNVREADLSPVASAAPNGDDLEPEYVDINSENEAVVTFQENNFLAVVDLATGATLETFDAGSVVLNNIDTEEEDLINLDSSLTKRREPDAVTWIDSDSFATANEGDYEDESGDEGGSRGFSIFNKDGTLEFESAESYEHLLVAAGHYNEGRSENKGCEPEGIEAGVFGGRTLLFVGAERCNAVVVYDVTSGTPEMLQILPTGIKPEGLKVMAKRNLFAASTEDAEDDIPAMINLYRTESGPSAYPSIQSGPDANGLPISWVALSGLAGDPSDASKLYAVSDSFLDAGFVYEIDPTTTPATIVSKVEVTGASAGLDLEGVAVGADGALWLGSEGNSGSRPNLVLKTDVTGAVLGEWELPADLVDMRRKNGIEGIAVTGDAGSETVYVVIQRAWPDEGDMDKVHTKIGRLDVTTGEWTFVYYPLQAEGEGGWIGLSELTALPDGRFAVIERDKGWGPSTGLNAELKAIYGIDLSTADFRSLDDPAGLVTIDKALLRDALPDLEANSIWTAEKLEGMAVSADGQLYLATDNDGVDDATGETLFLKLGDWTTALSPR